MNKRFNLATGRLGEQLARKFLEKNGYRVLKQNYRTKFMEVDLLCRKQGQEVLVEVRTKRGDNFGSPEESLDKKKLRKLWLSARMLGVDRVDAVCIVLGQGDLVQRLEHYQNIC